MEYHGLIWLLIFALAFGYGLPWLFAYHRKKRLAASGIADIDTMDGKAFEEYLEVLFGKLGYKVERTRYVGGLWRGPHHAEGRREDGHPGEAIHKGGRYQGGARGGRREGDVRLHGGDGRDQQHVHAGGSGTGASKPRGTVGS